MPMTGDVSNTKRTSGSPHVGEISVSKLLDLASVTIYQKCLMATDIGETIITFLQKDNDAIIPNIELRYQKLIIGILYDVNISTISASGIARDGVELALRMDF